jgi:hypothetical protein
MKTFRVQLDCGCCYADVQFESRESAFAHSLLGDYLY